MESRTQPTDIVTWAFSGTYDSSRTILIDAVNPARSITKQVAVGLVARLVGAFEEDTTVCLHLDNDILYPILSLSIYASKCRWTGSNTSNKVPELEHIFQSSNAKYVVTAAEHLEVVKAAVKSSGIGAEIILFADILELDRTPYQSPSCSRKFNPGHKSETFRDLHDLLSNGTPETLAHMLKDIDPQSIASLMSTSGTTGRPKMAARTHASTVLETAAIAKNEHDLKPYQVRRLFCTPTFHAFTMPELVINSIRLGHPAYIMKRFDDATFPAKIAEFEITETLAPPGVLLRLINNAACREQIQSLRAVYTGGAPLVPELKAKFLSLYPNEKPRIAPVWGMTEGGWFTTFKYPENDMTGSVGRPLPGFEIKMSLETPVRIADGRETGELLVRSQQLMAGYLNNPEATRTTFTDDGWLRTGDIGYVAEDGKVYLVDRAKDLIKVNGWQVSPVELEDALLISPDVKDSGVISSGEHVNEHPLAFVVRSDSSPDVTASELKAHMLTQLASYKVRSCEFQFINEIPRSATGKILRHELRALAVH
ncbi:hypothetical protein M409DRAFT_66809 [Zasmidium cellare ATCC 36951]|uniref:AMP-dependent synthetase/ligase domain-containing protein n=1 Tax=Zasmidium cellare ATCC 36951 TaxID=1080233 RepID=A0A6A6CJJ6_ZASCE|nr:uncharacterized protein M409DRAFT_66809 [Zasmidium cellare ATCC 36951]KAF2166368.1 hypothetical protein M409DRAFT_66809 [Zasmidium cellare ATCC 36951]